MSPSSTPDANYISSDQNSHSRQTSSGIGLFPAVPYQPPSIPLSMVSSSNFGGPCAHQNRTARYWSRCFEVQDDGQLQSSKNTSELDLIRDTGESLQQAMTRFRPYSLSACKLSITSSNERTELSGIWIRGPTRDVVLTVSHFNKDTKTTATAKNTTAEVFTTLTGDLGSGSPIKCELFHDYNDPGGNKDFAIFITCSGEEPRGPAQAIIPATILDNGTSLSGTVMAFGYNSQPATAIENHPDPGIHDCSCINCWQGSANLVCQKLNENMALPHPRILAPGLRVISVGEWMPHQNSRKVCHTVTGWYGISGAGMYTKDGQGNLRLVALFQGGIFRDPDSDKNEAVIIPSDVLRHVNKAGVA